jgi:hypothetical protein
MSRWSVAHSVAHIAAQNARGDAGLAPHGRADVIGLIESCGVQVFGDHADRLFGAYLPPEADRVAGVWLNAGLSVTDQRHTAAHEWGHRELEHGATCDLDIEGVSGNLAGRSRSLEETTAEAFAAWLLMPRAALIAVLLALGWKRGTAPTPLQCYETSLVLGTSYRGTARHLNTARVVDGTVTTALVRKVPGIIKNALDHPAAPPRYSRSDVWCTAHFARFDDIIVSAGDRLLIDPSDTEAGAVDALLDANRAELVVEAIDAVVLTAVPPRDRIAVAPVEVLLQGRPVRVHVDQPVNGLADAGDVPDLSAMTPEEFARFTSSNTSLSL